MKKNIVIFDIDLDGNRAFEIEHPDDNKCTMRLDHATRFTAAEAKVYLADHRGLKVATIEAVKVAIRLARAV